MTKENSTASYFTVSFQIKTFWLNIPEWKSIFLYLIKLTNFLVFICNS
ncbi:hypothetical protein LEP1GSC187_2034 [Leptospira santarosai str. ZUN179]|uniref:Uncharacterized protein n=1 Tax=Leptospira santarosai str. ZUN179 TaxID=1049985 RepID=M6UNN7_9LEPT|nr:hypothetical protein LEP1GSC187_2034 [Leptospira santarosai str. ZUN179]